MINLEYNVNTHNATFNLVGAYNYFDSLGNNVYSVRDLGLVPNANGYTYQGDYDSFLGTNTIHGGLYQGKDVWYCNITPQTHNLFYNSDKIYVYFDSEYLDTECWVWFITSSGWIRESCNFRQYTEFTIPSGTTNILYVTANSVNRGRVIVSRVNQVSYEKNYNFDSNIYIIAKSYFNNVVDVSNIILDNGQYVSVEMYNNSSEVITVNKDSFLTNKRIYYSILKESCSIINPVLLISDSIINYNYCYIPNFNRYYYITDVVSIKNNLWQVSLKVDVLMSFRSDILNLDCKIERQEFSFYDRLYDEELLISNRSLFSSTTITNIFPDILSPEPTFVITVAGTFNINDVSGEVRKIMYLASPNSAGSSVYITNKEGMYSFLRYLWLDTDWVSKFTNLFVKPIDGVISISYLPFSFVSFISLFGITIQPPFVDGKYEISFGDKIAKLDGIWFENRSYYPLHRTVNYQHGMPTPNFPSFLMNKVNYYMYIPFYGEVILDSKKMLGNEGYSNSGIFELELEIDCLSQSAIFNVRYPITKSIETYNLNLFYPIPITSSNLFEVFKNVGSLAINSAISLFNSKETFDKVPSSSVRKTTYRRNNKGNVTSTTTTYAKTPAVQGERFSFKKLDEGITNSIGKFGVSLMNTNMSPSIKGEKSNNAYCSGYLQETRYPYLIIEYPEIIDIPNYNHLIGRPSSYSGRLGNLTGFTIVGALHMKNFNTALAEEVDEIEDLLKSGVIL